MESDQMRRSHSASPADLLEGELRVRAAQAAVREAARLARPSTLPPALRQEVDALHEATLVRPTGIAKVLRGKALAHQTNEARRRESELLRSLGFASYSDYWISLTGALMDKERHARWAEAHDELAAAEAALVELRARS